MEEKDKKNENRVKEKVNRVKKSFSKSPGNFSFVSTTRACTLGVRLSNFRLIMARAVVELELADQNKIWRTILDDFYDH